MALVFGFAAAAKLRDHQSSALGATELGVPPRFVPVVSWLVPVLELVIAVSLLIPTTAAIGGGLGLTLLLAFTIAILRVRRTGRVPLCFCFGNTRAKPAGTEAIVRNVMLAVLCVVVVLPGR